MTTSLNNDGLDVQSHPTGVAVTYPEQAIDENLPGQLNLTDDEARDLEYMLREHRLNRLGIQPLSIPLSEVEKGDAFPSLGLRVRWARTDEQGFTKVRFEQFAHELEARSNLEITVHRSII